MIILLFQNNGKYIQKDSEYKMYYCNILINMKKQIYNNNYHITKIINIHLLKINKKITKYNIITIN